jgi:hypothetical protein
MPWIIRAILIGGGLLLLTLLAGLFWFIAIPVGLVALVYYGSQSRGPVARAKAAVCRYVDEEP